MLNNQKWYRIFEFIEQNKFEFELKTLLSPDFKKSNHILELEKSSILIDNSGDFIEFLELEQLILNNTLEVKVELENLNIEFIVELDKIIILIVKRTDNANKKIFLKFCINAKLLILKYGI